MNTSTTEPFNLEMSLIETSGLFFEVGEPKLVLWFAASHFPGTKLSEGRITTLVRNTGSDLWTNGSKSVSIDQSREFVGKLFRLGIPGRELDVAGVDDTSDCWSRLAFHLRLHSQAFHLELEMQSSGYDGSDANELRGIFRDVVSFAGYPIKTSAI